MSDTEKLDEAQKEPETERSEYFKNVLKFIGGTIGSVLWILLGCLISVLVLYNCKLAQSNILPTDINCSPYTDETGHEPEKIQTQIFTNMFTNKERKAMILDFPDPKNTWLEYLIKSCKEYKVKPKSSFYGNFAVAVFEGLLVGNLGFYNTIFSILNQFPEFLLVIFGPGILGFILFISSFYNAFSICYHWFSNLKWMWKKNNNISVNDETGDIEYAKYPDNTMKPPEWIDVHWNPLKNPDYEPDNADSNDPDDPKSQEFIKDSSEWGSWSLALVLALTLGWMIILALISQGLLIVSSGFGFLFIGLFLMYKINLAGKKASISDLLINFFKYNKLIIMSIFSFYVLTNAYAFLGPTSAGFAALTLFCIYYFKIIEMFVPVKTDKDERIPVEINTSQAYKVPCKEKEEVEKVPQKPKSSLMDRTRIGPSTEFKIKKNLGIKDSVLNLKDRALSMFGSPKIQPEPERETMLNRPAGLKPTSGLTEASGSTTSEEPTTTSGPTTSGLTGAASDATGALSDAKNKAIDLSTGALSGAKGALSDATGALSGEASSLLSNFKNTASVFPENSITKMQSQLGGKKRKPIQIDDNNLARTLKQFNKKYAQFLL
jgi:hypothetical protein